MTFGTLELWEKSKCSKLELWWKVFTTSKEKLTQILSKAKANYTPEMAAKIAEAAELKVIENRCPQFKEFRKSVLDC